MSNDLALAARAGLHLDDHLDKRFAAEVVAPKRSSCRSIDKRRGCSCQSKTMGYQN